QGMPARHEEEALVVVLQPNPVVESAEIVAQVQIARGANAREDPRSLGHGAPASSRPAPRDTQALAMRRKTSLAWSTASTKPSQPTSKPSIMTKMERTHGKMRRNKS